MESTEFIELIGEPATELLTESTEIITEITETVITTSCEHCDTFIQLLTDIEAYLSSIDTILFRNLQTMELFLAFGIAVLFSSVCYIILKMFTRF